MAELSIPWAPRQILSGRAFRMPVRTQAADVVLEEGAFPVLARRRVEQDGAFYYYLRAPEVGGDHEIVVRSGQQTARPVVQVRTLGELRGSQEYNGAMWPRRWPLGEAWSSTKQQQTLQDEPLGGDVDGEVLGWWLAQSDETLSRQLPPAELPRAHFVNVHQGCPQCGTAIFSHGGFYPWKRGHRPCDFRSECPACGAVFPSNDLAVGDYVGGDFVDDGYGYFDEEGHIYLFNATYHRDQARSFGAAIDLLTRHLRRDGFDAEVARKLGLMLLRYAVEEVYLAAVPQFRYGPSEGVEKAWDWGQVDWAAQADPVRSLARKGSVRYSIDTPYISETLALAYDTVWPFLREDEELVERARVLGVDVGSAMDTVLLVEEMLSCLLHNALDGGAASNLPRVSQGVLVLMRALDRPDAQEVMEWLYDRGPDRIRVFGRNNFFADGGPPESTGGYDSIHTNGLFDLEHHLRGLRAARPEAYPEARFASLVEGEQAGRIARFPHEMAVLGKSLFQFGDGGGGQQDAFAADAFYAPLPAETLARAAEFSGDARVRALHASVNSGERRALGTTVHDGKGIAILRTGEAPERAAAGVAYGDAVGHRHMDLLDVQLFAFDRPFLSDLGYPQSWASIANWEAHWATHNTVWGLVPGLATQRVSGRGRLVRSLFAPGVQVLDVEAERWVLDEETGCWRRPGVSFRRLLALVETDGEGVVLVDLARVRGGSEHWRTCRGLEGQFVCDQPGVRRAGTVAGAQIERGELDQLPHAEYAALAYMDDVKVLTAAPSWHGTWEYGGDGTAKLDLHQLRATPSGEIFSARATAIMGSPEESTYGYRALLWKSSGVEPGATTCVDLVFEPRLGEATLAAAEAIEVVDGAPSAAGVELRTHQDRCVRIYWAPDAGLQDETRFADCVCLRGALAVESDGAASSIGASAFGRGDRVSAFPQARQRGRITALDGTAVEVEGLEVLKVGDRIRINADGRGHNYRVEAAAAVAAGRQRLELDMDALLGRARVRSVEEGRLDLDFHVIARSGNLEATRLRRADGRWHEIAAAWNPDPGSTALVLTEPVTDLCVGEWVEVVDFVVGDEVLFEPLCGARAPTSHWSSGT